MGEVAPARREGDVMGLPGRLLLAVLLATEAVPARLA